MKKKMRLIIGLFLIILLGTIGYYQIKLNQFKGIQNVPAIQVKKGVTITKGMELNSTMFELVMTNKNRLPEGYCKSLAELKNKVALENLYSGDYVTNKRIQEKSNWDNDNVRYVSLMGDDDKDNFAGNDIKPGDRIDIFIYDAATQTYNLRAENIEILDVKDKNLVSYINRKDTFIPKSIYFKSSNDKYKSLIDELSKPQAEFKITIHGNRPKLDNETSNLSSNGVIGNFIK